MFLKQKVFKEILTEAWKAGNLIVGNDGEGIYLLGAYWTIWLERNHITKKAKATIIELTGELPPAEYVFRASQQGNQYELKETYIDTLYHPDISKGEEYYKTGLTIGNVTECSILQNRENFQNVLVVRKMVDIVDIKSMEEEENLPEGPCKLGDTLYWQNEFCTYGVCRIQTREDGSRAEILRLLSRYDFEKEMMV